ncbi:hypothetical protein F8388_002072 [Cannabis sativa]|uniref:RNase H type-1 domain-containing protein n=1 Tax=Cannabis sativa TaxID=3483 RepID=A0A7J6H2Q9_CANSA|nr:hypothetical protein F8388_002072 [Cannabis sativa]KAF4389241.1 hypothetical protein G4B88_003054 [Cannabis sativa]
MADANLSSLFEDAVQVTTKDITCDLHPGEVDHNEEPNRILLGKLYCCSRLGRKAIYGSLRNAWSSISGWSWKERDDGLLQFTFRSRFDAENVLLRRPWVVCGFLLVLMPWPSWLTPAEVAFDQTPIWVRLKSIPPFYWNKTNLQELAGKVSASYDLPKHIERNFERGSFGMGTVRFRATVDVNKPLFSSFYLRRKGIKDLWIQYQYEKMPKICFKCGVLSHEHKFCFKTPTVIKDETGAFYPMFGSWMGEDAVERSPFHLPLPNWFKDWIAQQQVLKDPKIKNQMKMQRRWKEAEAYECRELRRQMPGKRRQVEVVIENRVQTGEVVLNRFPSVYLPGTGEITPFENTAEGVVEKVIPERPVEQMATFQAAPPNTDSEKPDTELAKSDIGLMTTNPSGIENKEEGLPDTQPQHQNSKFAKASKVRLMMSSANATNPLLNDPRDIAVTEKENFTLQSDFTVGAFVNPLLGPQAQPLEWPSRICWARAFGPLTGSATVDKFQREPTLFNPILNIDDFKSFDNDNGPRKRKAVDGFFMVPGVIPAHEGTSSGTAHDSSESNVQKSIELEDNPTTFSPGSSESKLPKRRRGRPRKVEDPPSSPTPSSSKRGRPTKSKSWIGATPKSFKKKGVASSSKENHSQYRNLWNANGIELAIDLHNKFVVIGKNKENSTSCQDKNWISGTIQSDPPGTKWNLLGIYGPPTLNGKEAFWTRVAEFCVRCQSPTLLLGDLNGTLADNESINYTNHGNSARYSFDLRRMVAQTGLVDLGCMNGKFTWFQRCAGSIGGTSVKRARLDRALASVDWRLLFPNAVVECMTVSTSDHKPILLNTDGGARCTKAQFKYELMWGRDPRCYWVVRNAWRDQLHLNPMINMYRKLKKTKEYLQRWNKTHFRKIQQQVMEARSDRNRRTIGEKKEDMMRIIDIITLKIKDHVMASLKTLPDVLSWTPPPPKWKCCNSDVAILNSESVISAVLRDEWGNVVAIKTAVIQVTNPMLAEAHAVCLAADLSISLGETCVMFQSDNLNVVQEFAVSTSSVANFRLQCAKERFMVLCSKFIDWGIIHISRKCNFMAHNVARWAARLQMFGNICTDMLPSAVLDDFVEWDPGSASPTLTLLT